MTRKNSIDGDLVGMTHHQQTGGLYKARPYNGTNGEDVVMSLDPFVHGDIIAYRAHRTGISPIALSDDPQAVSMPSNLAFSRGGQAAWEGTPFNLELNGVYRFWRRGVSRSGEVEVLAGPRQLIVTNGDPFDLATAMAWCTAHGTLDNNMGNQELVNQLRHRKLRITCGPVAHLTAMIAAGLGIRGRAVELHRLGTNPMPLGNGHTMVELFDPGHGKWLLFDPDNKVYFTAESEPLSFAEFFIRAPRGDYEIVPLAPVDGGCSGGFLDAKGVEQDFSYDLAGSGEEALRRTYRYCCEAPVAFINGTCLVDERLAARFNFSGVTVPLQEFFGVMEQAS